MTSYLTVLVLLVLLHGFKLRQMIKDTTSYQDYQVTGRCTEGTETNEIDSNWSACFVAEKNEKDGNCPHGFQKIKTEKQCERRFLFPPEREYKNLVCCVISPTFDLKIIQSACVAGRDKPK